MEAVEAKLGQPDIVDQSLYYFDSELRFDFSEKGRLEFIEFLGGYYGNIQPIIYGIQAFQVNADELYRILADHNTGNIIDMNTDIRSHFLTSELEFIGNLYLAMLVI